jgi:flavin reductase (DIM6/NTAB) family NADH-FMN oxidoreductase RutF
MTDLSIPTVDPQTFRSVMGRFATGVTVVSFMRDAIPAGITVNAFLSVSMDPPLVLVSVRTESSFTAHVRVGVCYGVNVLSESQESLAPHFSRRPMAGETVPFRYHHGTPLIDGSLAHLIARVVDVHPAGDHLLYIAAIEHLWHGTEARPLIFFSGKYKQIHAHEPTMQWNAVDGW